jgi:hypothetical protein
VCDETKKLHPRYWGACDEEKDLCPR